MKSLDIVGMDESNENEVIDNRDLKVYSWRQILEKARNIPHDSSLISTSPSPIEIFNLSSVIRASSKRKSDPDT